MGIAAAGARGFGLGRGLPLGGVVAGPVEEAQQHEDEGEHQGRADDPDSDPRLVAERRLGGGEDRGQPARPDQLGQEVAGHGEGEEGDRRGGEPRHRQIERVAADAAHRIGERP